MKERPKKSNIKKKSTNNLANLSYAAIHGLPPCTNIGIISDFHCGHLTGMCPTRWQWTGEDDETTFRGKEHKYQKWAWAKYLEYIKELGPFDKLIVLGDCVDGKGAKGTGKEHLTTDPDEQAEMAIATILACECNVISIARGSGYHTGVTAEDENKVAAILIAKGLTCGIHDHDYINVNHGTEGEVSISARHFIGGTSVVSGKATAILKEQSNNDQWSREYPKSFPNALMGPSQTEWEDEQKEYQVGHPKCNIFLRGHLHRSIIIDEPSTLSIIAPGLQGWTSFGARQCPLPVHFGMMSLQINSKGEWQWRRRTAQLGQFVHVTKW